MNFEVFTGDWNDIPNGLWICSGDNAHSPAGSDGYQWLVNCEKNLSVNNYMQQAYRITGASSATKTLYRYGNSTGWRDWYSPYITNADLPILTVRTGTRYWTQYTEVSGQKRIYFYNADFPSGDNLLGYIALTK